MISAAYVAFIFLFAMALVYMVVKMLLASATQRDIVFRNHKNDLLEH